MRNSIKAILKKTYLRLTGKVSHLRKTIQCKHIWYGDRHAGFYVYPDILNQDSIIYSFGIGENISFDKVLIDKHQSQVFAFDPTPKSIHWLQLQKLPENYHYFEYGIAVESGFVDFYLPKNPTYVSGSLVAQHNVNTNEKVSVQMKTFTDILAELGHSHIDILKMDIEGAEYDVIDSILNSGLLVPQLLIEFHDRFFKNGAAKSKQVISRLQENGYEIFAVSDNFEEISFVHRSVL